MTHVLVLLCSVAVPAGVESGINEGGTLYGYLFCVVWRIGFQHFFIVLNHVKQHLCTHLQQILTV
jgi:hypothetical protein